MKTTMRCEDRKRTKRTRRRDAGRLGLLAAATALLIPLVATGCGDDENGMGPDGTATFRAVVTDDPGTAGASVAGTDPDARGSVSGTADVQGTFRGQAKVQVSADGQTWVDLGSMESVDVALQSGGEAILHSSAQVDARSYTRVRLVVQSAEATVLAGSTLDAGPISADVTVDVAGGGEFMVEKSVTVDADAGATTTLVFDLNSETWLNQTTVDARSATAAQVSSATSVRVR